MQFVAESPGLVLSEARGNGIGFVTAGSRVRPLPLPSWWMPSGSYSLGRSCRPPVQHAGPA